MNVLKKYDKKLSYKKNLDGSLDVLRESIYKHREPHVIKKFENQFPGSMMWIVEVLKSMDSTRFDFFANNIEKNLRIRKGKTDSRMHSDIADYIRNGQQFVS